MAVGLKSLPCVSDDTQSPFFVTLQMTFTRALTGTRESHLQGHSKRTLHHH